MRALCGISRVSCFGRRYSRVASEGERFAIWNGVTKSVVPLRSRSTEERSRSSSRDPNVLSWYACGPTVYDRAHIGHASSYIRQDVIRRLLEGGIGGQLSVLQLMGVTDIDDKIIFKANQLKTPWETISRKYELEFFEDLESLNVKLPHVRTRVSDFIPQIISFVSDLVDKGFAYPVQDGSVYFDTKKYEGYGKLRNVGEILELVQEQEEGGGGEKRNKQDFAVWKGWKPGEPFWTTPFGKGRPGWHIECSVMASHYFGQKLDIHSGGVDLIFPHHENEEAQCCAKFGVQDWVKHWIHTGHLNIKGDTKMSKSLGNTITIQDFLKDHSAQTLRMFCMLSKYRSGLEYSQEAIFHAKSLFKKLQDFTSDTTAILQSSKLVSCQSNTEDLWTHLVGARRAVFSSLTNDFDTPSAIHKISEYIDTFNRTYAPCSDQGGGSGVDFGLVLSSKELVSSFISLVGLEKRDERADSSIRVESLLEEITRFRGVVRNYALAFDEKDKLLKKKIIEERKPLLEACDQVRTNLSELGFELKDHGKSSSATSSSSVK